jgi:hypothetical protein
MLTQPNPTATNVTVRSWLHLAPKSKTRRPAGKAPKRCDRTKESHRYI